MPRKARKALKRLARAVRKAKRHGHPLRQAKHALARHAKRAPHHAHGRPHKTVKSKLEQRKQRKVVEAEKPTEYSLIKPFAKAVIRKEGKILTYNVSEVKASTEEELAIGRVKAEVIETMEASVDLSAADKEAYLKKKFEEYKQRFLRKFEPAQEERIFYFLKRDFLGLERVEPMMHDPNLEDISCDGVNIPIYVSHKEFGPLKTNVVFDNYENLEAFVIKLAQKCGRFISYGEPLLDGGLPDGSRVQATFGAGVTMKGPTFDIRKFRETPFTPIDLIELNTFSPEALAFLWMAIEARKNILVVGGTASGKSTVLNAISLFIPENLKIVSIEDTPELNLLHENWVQSVARSGLGSGGKGQRYGEVTMFDLLKASFRQRPDYVIVGEVRGKEATVMFQGMASGHSGLGTMHAESLEAVIERLSTPPISLPPSLIRILDILVLQISAHKIKENARRAKEIVEVIPQVGKEIRSNAAFRWDPHKDKLLYTGRSVILDALQRDMAKSGKHQGAKAELDRRAEYLLELRRKKVMFNDFPVWIRLYQQDADKAFKLLRESGA
jgi:flagellar protein FlaI